MIHVDSYIHPSKRYFWTTKILHGDYLGKDDIYTQSSKMNLFSFHRWFQLKQIFQPKQILCICATIFISFETCATNFLVCSPTQKFYIISLLIIGLVFYLNFHPADFSVWRFITRWTRINEFSTQEAAGGLATLAYSAVNQPLFPCIPVDAGLGREGPSIPKSDVIRARTKVVSSVLQTRFSSLIELIQLVFSNPCNCLVSYS
jgi:hypothetical protein